MLKMNYIEKTNKYKVNTRILFETTKIAEICGMFSVATSDYKRLLIDLLGAQVQMMIGKGT